MIYYESFKTVVAPRGSNGSFPAAAEQNGGLPQSSALDHERIRMETDAANVSTSDFDISTGQLQSSLAEEQAYKDFYDRAPDLLFTLDARNGRILECNQTACDALGYRKGEIVGRDIFQIYAPESRERARRTFQSFLRTGYVHDVELAFCRRDGRRIDISLSATAVRQGTEIVRSRSICRVITELRETEKSLQRSEAEAKARAQELEAILDAVPAMTFIAHDPACKAMTSSRTAYELLRLPHGANSSKSAPRGQRPMHFQVLRDGKALSTDDLPVQQAAATGLPVRDAELRIAFKDGTCRDIYGHAVPLLNEHGHVRGAVGAFVDITERKKAEQELRKSEARLRRFFDANLVGIFSSNLKRNFIQANDVFLNMLGYTREEFLAGKLNWKSITPPEMHARGDQAIEELKATGKFAPFEKEYIRKDGSRVPILIGAATITQTPLEWMCFVLDLSERKRIEELKTAETVRKALLEREILAREEERRQLARELHDESGQMLASLLAGLNTIQNAKHLNEAKSRAERLKRITSLAMDELGRISRGLHPLALDDLGLKFALKSFIDEYRQTHGTNVELKIVGLGSRRLAKNIEAGVYRIAQEAFTNIAKYARATTAEISLSVRAGVLELRIADNGRGFRADNILLTTAGKHLGLQGMRERASMLGGDFAIVSQRGKGTVKTLRIPAAFAEPGKVTIRE